jgi:hypothetical protein
MDEKLSTEEVRPLNVTMAEPEKSVLDPVSISTPPEVEKDEKEKKETPFKQKLVVTILAFSTVFLLGLLIGVLLVR